MFPMKKHAWRDQVKTGAPVPSAEHTPAQQQKGTDSNAAPPNSGGGMPISKPSAGRNVSMPKHLSMKNGKEAPPASNGGKVGLSRAGESAQPTTADVVPDVSGGQPSAMGSGTTSQPEMMMDMLSPEMMLQTGGQPMLPQPDQGVNIAELIRQIMLASGQMQQPTMFQSRV